MDGDKKINGTGQLIFKKENKVNRNLIKKMRNVKLKERKNKNWNLQIRWNEAGNN